MSNTKKKEFTHEEAMAGIRQIPHFLATHPESRYEILSDLLKLVDRLEEVSQKDAPEEMLLKIADLREELNRRLTRVSQERGENDDG